MVNSNCMKSMNKKLVLHEDHDYCGANVTRKNADNKEHHFEKKSLRFAISKWTDRSSMQSCTVDDWKKVIDREIAVDKVQYLFLTEQQIREKVCRKFGIPVVMGDVLSRASHILSATIPSASKDSPEDGSQKMPQSNEIIELEDREQISSQEKRRLDLLEQRQRSVDQNETEDSGIAPTTSEPSQSITPDLEFPCPATMELQTSQRIDSIDPLPDIEFSNSTIYSQPTQIVSQNFRLPNFQQTFGSRAPCNFSQQFQSDSPKYPSSSTSQFFGPGLSDGDTMNPQHFYQSPPSNSPSISRSDPQGFENYENLNSYDFTATQSTATALHQMETQIALYPEFQKDNTDSNDLSLSLSISTISNTSENDESAESVISDLTDSSVSSSKLLSDARKLLESELQNGNADLNEPISPIMDVSETRQSVDSVTTNFSVSTLIQSDAKTRVSIDKQWSPNYTPDHQDFDENLIENRVQNPPGPQGGKMIEPESLYTDTEESCKRVSPILDMMNGDYDSSKVVENPGDIIDLEISGETGSFENSGEVPRTPYNFSVGTKLSPSLFLPKQNQCDDVSLDHSYIARISNSSSFHNQSATNSNELEVFPEFSGNDHNYVKNVFHGRVRKMNTSQLDCHEDKENSFVRHSEIGSHQNPVSRTLRFDLNGSEGSDDLRSPEIIQPQKKMRLCSPERRKGLLTARRSNIVNRVLTPYYPEYRNTNFRVLTPYYPPKENAEHRVSTPFNSCRQKEEPELIDLTSDIEDEEAVVNCSFNANVDVKTEETEANIEASSEGQTAFQNESEHIESPFVLSEELPILQNFTNDENVISQLLNPAAAVTGPIVEELFSDRCCEYDREFLDVHSKEILTYEPRLLKHLFEQSDEVIQKNIDDALALLDF